MPRFFTAFIVALVTIGAAPDPVLALPSSPQKLMRELAQAVKEKDVEAFKNLVDISALLDVDEAQVYAENGILAPHYFKQRDTEFLLEGIASGVLARQCKEALRPGCPWYSRGLELGKVVKGRRQCRDPCRGQRQGYSHLAGGL